MPASNSRGDSFGNLVRTILLVLLSLQLLCWCVYHEASGDGVVRSRNITYEGKTVKQMRGVVNNAMM